MFFMSQSQGKNNNFLLLTADTDGALTVVKSILGENLELRRDEFAGKLSNLTGVTLAEAEAEVDKSVQRLFYWASYADKYGGTVQETQLYGTVIKIHEPVGVIGIFMHSLKPPHGGISGKLNLRNSWFLQLSCTL